MILKAKLFYIYFRSTNTSVANDKERPRGIGVPFTPSYYKTILKPFESHWLWNHVNFNILYSKGGAKKFIKLISVNNKYLLQTLFRDLNRFSFLLISLLLFPCVVKVIYNWAIIPWDTFYYWCGIYKNITQGLSFFVFLFWK